MAFPKQIIRSVLFVHGLLNVAQGLYCVFRPADFAAAAGQGFVGAPDKAVQSIGLGSIGVGAYGAQGAWTSNRRFYLTTVLLRLCFAAIGLVQWGWSNSAGMIIYEGSVAVIAGMGLLT